MTSKNNLLSSFICLLPILAWLISGCGTRKPIVVSESLNNSSERWEAKVMSGNSSIGRPQFGPYSTISSKKLDSPKLKSFDYQFSFFFRSEETRKKRTVFSLVVSQNLDTARVNFFLWQKTSVSYPGLFGLKNDNISYKYKDAEGEIYILSDTPVCVFKIHSLPVSLAFIDWSDGTSGFMICFQDTLKISNIYDFNEFKIGISLENHEGQIAVLQLERDNNVWISKNLPAQTRLAIAAFFCVILGARKV